LATITRVVTLYPKSISDRNDMGEFPLHTAARLSLALDVIRALYNRSPNTISARDFYGNTPFHSAVSTSPSSNTIQFLMGKYKAAVRIPNFDGSLLLHLLCAASPNYLGDIRMVAEMNLDALKRPDRYGRLPLHRYCERPNSSPVLLYLVNENPATCSVRDNEGNLPIHICAKNKSCSHLAIQHLVNKNKQALTIRNDDGYLPAHLYLMATTHLHLD
jgi:ankyrin repeat protein